MKTKFPYLTGLVTLSLSLPASADTIYSGLLNTTIPTDFTGTTVIIAGGTLNPFFGGVGVANNNLLLLYFDTQQSDKAREHIIQMQKSGLPVAKEFVQKAGLK